MNRKRFLALLLALVLCAAAVPSNAYVVGTIVVKYVTGADNKKVADSATYTGMVGGAAQITTPDVGGYEFIGFTNKKGEDIKQFIFKADSQTVYAHYSKQVKATVKYVDQNGSTVADPSVFYGYSGQTYTVSPPYVPGYTQENVKDPRHGVFGTKDHTITVVYRAASWGAKTAHVTAQCIDQNNGQVLRNLMNSDVAINTTINLSDYQHAVNGYQFTGVYVNGQPTRTTSVTVAGNVNIVYYYVPSGYNPWPVPITTNASLIVYAMDEDGSVITVLENTTVPQGTAYPLNAPSMNGYSYDHTTVNGRLSYDSYVNVNYDTTVYFYYDTLYFNPMPGIVTPDDPYSTNIIPAMVAY